MIQAGRLIVNLDAGAVSVDDQPVHLTGKEYGILELLSRHKGTTVTKEMFLNHLYGGMNETELKIIDVFICKLRKKLAHATGGNHHIETVWGRGYVLATRRQRRPSPNRPGTGQYLCRCHTLRSSPSSRPSNSAVSSLSSRSMRETMPTSPLWTSLS